MKYLENLLNGAEVEWKALGEVCKDVIVPMRDRPKIFDGNIPWPTNNFIVSTGFTTIDIIDKEIHPKFIYYSLTRKEITDRLNQIAATNVSAYPSINPSDIGNTQLTIPSLYEDQQKIASVLSALDAKIEINNCIIAELEAMAKQLYNYWFVQFDFPDANGKPYRSSAGKMVYNEKLKREIPEGWGVKSIIDISNHITDSINPFDFPIKKFKHFSIPAYDSTEQGFIIEDGSTIMSNKFIFGDNDLLVSKLNPWFNRVLYAQDLQDQICSTEFVIMRCDYKLKDYLYSIVKSQHFIEYCKLKATGTSNSHKRIDPDIMMKYSFPFESVIAEKYNHATAFMNNKILKLKAQNSDLSSLRDWLLPMLMNGQAKIK